MVRRHMTNKKGFTLIELMTTVAIIGTLAAVGVPQYRRFQRRARRAEANVLLGAISAANSSFLAEFNTYGNVLAAIGLDLEAQPQNYVCGFSDAAGQLAQFPAAAAFPIGPLTAANYAGGNFNPVIVGYAAGDRRIASVGSTGANGGAVPATFNPPAGAGVAAMTANTYTANCIANLRGGAATAATNDVMTITQTGTITIAQDGT